MDKVERFIMDIDTAIKNPTLLSDVAGVHKVLPVLTFAIAITSRGIGVSVSGGQLLPAILAVLGDPFKSWIEKTSSSIVECREMQAALRELDALIGGFMEGTENG